MSGGKIIERNIVVPATSGAFSRVEVDAAGRFVAVERRSPNAGLSATVYDVKSGEIVVDGLERASITPDGKRLYGCTKTGAFAMDLPDGTRDPLPMKWVNAAGNRFAFSTSIDELFIVDGASRKQTGTLASPSVYANVPGAHRPRFSAQVPLGDDKTLVWLDARFTVHLIDLEQAKVTAKIKAKSREVPEWFVVSRDGTRALGRGSKGTYVMFDLVNAKVLCAREKVYGERRAWLDDGRLVLEAPSFDLLDLEKNERKSFGTRDPNREFIETMVPLTGPRFLVLLHRSLDPKAPWNTTRTLEVWDVDEEEVVARCTATWVIGPLYVIDDTYVLATERTEDMRAHTMLRRFDLELPKPKKGKRQ